MGRRAAGRPLSPVVNRQGLIHPREARQSRPLRVLTPTAHRRIGTHHNGTVRVAQVRGRLAVKGAYVGGGLRDERTGCV
jgi:hypothetical protein